MSVVNKRGVLSFRYNIMQNRISLGTWLSTKLLDRSSWSLQWPLRGCTCIWGEVRRLRCLFRFNFNYTLISIYPFISVNFWHFCIRDSVYIIQNLHCLGGSDLRSYCRRSTDSHPQMWPDRTGRDGPHSVAKVVHVV